MSTGQVWLTNTLGGYMWSPALSKVLRVVVQPLVKFRQFADVKDAAVQGKGKGQEFHWNVYSDVATQGTTLLETTTMPETNYTITQGTMTITEYGNSVPYTEKLDDLSLHPVKEVIAKVLKNDAKKAFDIAAYNQFNATPLTVAPTAGTATDVVTLVANDQNFFGIPACFKTAFAVWRDLILLSTGKRVLVMGLDQISWSPLPARSNRQPAASNRRLSSGEKSATALRQRARVRSDVSAARTAPAYPH
jgi:hypothetical protein